MKDKPTPESEIKMVLINLYMPSDLVSLVDSAVESEDTDRSKFIRAAIREKINRARKRLQLKET